MSSVFTIKSVSLSSSILPFHWYIEVIVGTIFTQAASFPVTSLLGREEATEKLVRGKVMPTYWANSFASVALEMVTWASRYLPQEVLLHTVDAIEAEPIEKIETKIKIERNMCEWNTVWLLSLATGRWRAVCKTNPSFPFLSGGKSTLLLFWGKLASLL